MIGVEASGTVTADDYRTVLLPMIDTAHADGSKVRLLYVLGDDTDFTAGGAWADAKLGAKHFASFDRIAVVTDEDWLEHMVNAMGWIMPGQTKGFDDDDRDDAIAWLAEG